LGVELAIDDAVERHRAGAGADDGGDDEEEEAPAGPAALIARGHRHGGEREGKREDGVGDLYELRPFGDLGDRAHGAVIGGNEGRAESKQSTAQR
jgi:hypothetical protein